MSMTNEQQQALDDALVPREQRLMIDSCNYRLSTTFKPKEPTFQVTLDVLTLTPFYPAFLITASVPAVYMQEFWATVTYQKHHIRFKMNKKSYSFHMETFRNMLQMCPKLPGQKFVDPPFEEEILTFIRELGYPGNIKLLSDVKVDTLPQPWAQILWGLYHLKNVDYVYLLLEDLVYQIENKESRKNKYIFIPQHEVVQRYGVILPEYLTNQAIKESEAYKTYHDLAIGKVQPKPKYVRRSSRSKTEQAPKPSPAGHQTKLNSNHSSHASGSGAHEGTGATPGVPDVPKYGSDDEQLSWKSSDVEDDDDEVNVGKDEDDDDHDDDDEQTESDNDGEDFVYPKVQPPSHDSTTDDDDDDERTESDNDGEDFVHPNFLTYDEEAMQEEEENKEDSFDPRIQTPSHVSTNNDDNDDEIQGANVVGEEMDKEATNALRESSFQNIRPRKFLRSGSRSNVGYEKSCQSSKFGSDLGQITRFVLVFVEAAKQSGEQHGNKDREEVARRDPLDVVEIIALLSGILHCSDYELSMSPPIRRKYRDSVAFANGCRRIKKCKRCNRKIRIPIGMWPCYETSEEELVEQPRRHDLYGFVDHPQLQQGNPMNEFAPHRLPQPEGNMNGWLMEDEEELKRNEVDSDIESTASSKPMWKKTTKADPGRASRNARGSTTVKGGIYNYCGQHNYTCATTQVDLQALHKMAPTRRSGPNNNENPDIAAIIAQQLQTILPQIVTQITNNMNNANGGNGGNVTPEYPRFKRYIAGLAPEIRGMLRATQPTTIQSAILIAGILTDEAISYGTLTKVNPEGQQQSSSVSSGFVSNMLNPRPDTGIESIFTLNTEETLLVDVSVTTIVVPPLLSATTLPPPPNPLITHLQQTPVPTPATVTSSSLQDLPNFGTLFGLKAEAQAKNEDFLNKLDNNIKKIIKNQVKEQVKAQVSKILPKIDKTVNKQLEAEIMTRSSTKSKTSLDIAANLSELEMKKILIEKMESNKSIHRSNEQKNLYKALSAGESAHTEEPMHIDKDLEEPAHQEFDIGATKEKSDEETSQHPNWQENPRESFDELTDTPFDFSAFMMNRLNVETLTPKLLAGPTFELMKGTCKSLVELENFFEEVYKETTEQLDWYNPEGQSQTQARPSIRLSRPLPRHVVIGYFFWMFRILEVVARLSILMSSDPRLLAYMGSPICILALTRYSFVILFDCCNPRSSLISLSRGSFDVIMGIDWLSKRKFVIVCHEKVVEIPLEGSRKLRVQGERTLGVAKALMYAKVDEPKVGDISVVRGYVDVFPEDLSGLPPQRQVEFRIDLVHGATSVAKSPYRLAPLEMQELSEKLRELQDKISVRITEEEELVTYLRFIANFSKIVKPITSLTERDQKYEWGAERKEAFQTLKNDLCDASINRM
ncbi:hypothetical protein Tco_1283198 [Tanacetum coccineum]